MKTTKSPQEKKALSYEKDRRNNYRANDKASRKAIPMRKALVNKVYRHQVNGVLKQAVNLLDKDQIEDAGDEVRSVGLNNWKKKPDAPLGEVVPEKIQNRIDHAGQGKTKFKATRAFLKTLRTAVTQLDPERWMAHAVDYPHLVAYASGEERALEKLRHIAEVAQRNETGENIRVQIDGEFITPRLSK